MEKTCSKCHNVFPLNMFRNRPERGELGVHSKCKECEKKYRKELYDKNPERHREHSAKCRAKGDSHRFWVHGTMANHKISNNTIGFTLDEMTERAKRTTHCCLCNIKLQYGGGKHVLPNSPSLDNIDMNVTLTMDNTMIICQLCNQSKSNRTMAQLVEYCNLILKKHNATKTKRIISFE